MTDLVTFTATASLPKEVVPILCTFLGMPPVKRTPNPLYVEGDVQMEAEEGEEAEVQLEFIDEDWSHEEEKAFIENHVRGLLAEMISGMPHVGAEDTIAETIRDNIKALGDATAARHSYIKSSITMTHEDQ